MKKIILIVFLGFVFLGVIILVMIKTDYLIIGIETPELPQNYKVETHTIDATLKKYSAIHRSESSNYLFLNFWGVGCGPCMKEIPLLNKIYKETQQGKVDFYAIASCDSIEGDRCLRANDLNIDFAKLYDIKGLRISMRANIEPKQILHDAIPLTIVLGSRNEVLFYKNQALTEDDVDSVIRVIRRM